MSPDQQAKILGSLEAIIAAETECTLLVEGGRAIASIMKCPPEAAREILESIRKTGAIKLIMVEPGGAQDDRKLLAKSRFRWCR